MNTVKHTDKEIDKRIKGIVASASFEDMKLTQKEISMLKKLGKGKITKDEYDEYFKLK